MARARFRLRVTVAALAPAFLAACASAPRGRPAAGPPELSAARRAVESARRAGAADHAADTLRHAEQHLREAERAVEQGAKDPSRAHWLARLAETEANCARLLAERTASTGGRRASSDDAQRMASQLRQSEEERRRLEERVALIQRDLELTEAEVLRGKARQQGTETRAEASSAIAEARILMQRLDARARASRRARCEELLAKAEQQLREENYRAAVFFARKAQDVANRAP